MPQSPISDLVVTDSGTVVRKVDTFQFTGAGVSVEVGSPNPRVAVVNIPGGGTGDVVGPLSATNGHLAVFDGTTGKLIKDGGAVPAGGGAYLTLESGTIASKISALPTLASIPLAPVYDAVITNDGTTAANFQRPQGNVQQPTATGSANGVDIRFGAGYATGSGRGGSLNFTAGNAVTGNPGTIALTSGSGTIASGTVVLASGGVTNPGTSGTASVGNVIVATGGVTITDPAGSGNAGQLILGAGNAYGTGINASGASIYAVGGSVAGTVANGGGINISGGGGSGNNGGTAQLLGGQSYGVGNHGGDAVVKSGDGDTAGNVTIKTGAFNATAGNIIMPTLPTSAPAVSNALWRDTITNTIQITP